MLSVDEYLPRGATFIKKTNKTTTVFSEEESYTLMSPLHVPGFQEKMSHLTFLQYFCYYSTVEMGASLARTCRLATRSLFIKTRMGSRLAFCQIL